MITVRRQPKYRRYDVRLHCLFADAPLPMIRSLARYIVYNDQIASAKLGDYIDEQEHRIRPAPEPAPRRTIIRTRGKVYDLQQIYDDLNATYFDSALKVNVTWGRQAARGRARHSVRLGSYCYEEELIRIHPGLDQSWVPLFYIEWVLYHEMLHAVHPVERVGRRRHFHTPAFLAQERRFREYAAASAWEKSQLARAAANLTDGDLAPASLCGRGAPAYRRALFPCCGRNIRGGASRTYSHRPCTTRIFRAGTPFSFGP